VIGMHVSGPEPCFRPTHPGLRQLEDVSFEASLCKNRMRSYILKCLGRVDGLD
jgi:hypothetical protein